MIFTKSLLKEQEIEKLKKKNKKLAEQIGTLTSNISHLVNNCNRLHQDNQYFLKRINEHHDSLCNLSTSMVKYILVIILLISLFCVFSQKTALDDWAKMKKTGVTVETSLIDLSVSKQLFTFEPLVNYFLK